MTRLCKCGCLQPLPDTAPARRQFIDGRHRAVAHRSLFVKAGSHPRAGKNARSGSQISYVKARELLAVWIRGNAIYGTPDPVDAERVAELVLRGALSERQAERERQRERS